MISYICLSLSYLIKYDNLWVHPFHCKWYYIIGFFFNDWVIFHCIYVPHLLYPFCLSIDGHLGSILVPAVGNRAAVNIGVHVSSLSLSLLNTDLAVLGLSCGTWNLFVAE